MDLCTGLATTMIGLFIFYNSDVLSGNFAKVYGLIILANSLVNMMIHFYNESANESSISVVRGFSLISIVAGILWVINEEIDILILLLILSLWAILYSGAKLLHIWKMRELPARIHFVLVIAQSLSVFLAISIFFNLHLPNFFPISYVSIMLIMTGLQNIILAPYLLQVKGENSIANK